MHGVVDNEVPLRSYLGFQSGDLAGDFEKLLLAELYAFDLDARMVVLSACNSGMGRLHASEGMISLSRAFAYGGADAVVMSRWSVADKSTAGLMERFYRQLKKGESKDEALRQAKLTYLTEVDDPLFSHPYYWASFVVIGDVQPIYQNTMWRWAWMPIAVLLFWWLFRYVYYRME
jgi:CHAT domain-containing protein